MTTPPSFAIVPVNLAPQDGFDHIDRHRDNPAIRGRTRRVTGMGTFELGPVINDPRQGRKGAFGNLGLPFPGKAKRRSIPR